MLERTFRSKSPSCVTRAFHLRAGAGGLRGGDRLALVTIDAVVHRGQDPEELARDPRLVNGTRRSGYFFRAASISLRGSVTISNRRWGAFPITVTM